MTFRNRLQYLMVWRIKLSNKQAIDEILKGNVRVNGLVQRQNIEISIEDEVEWNGQIIQVGEKFIYLAFYKPVGIETTLNESISDNLKNILPFKERLFPVGRLDKASEGLLLLTNDGNLFKHILKYDNRVEKEYLVTVDSPITTDFVRQMATGIRIMGKITLPCKVVQLEEKVFQIVLIQGMNRQIRRICYQLGYEVTQLKRVRIGNVVLEDLRPMNYRVVEKSICYDFR